jgi:hypothetical protein
MTKDEMRSLLIEEVKGLSQYLSNPTDYDNALDDASRETWAFPVSTDFKIYWMKQRAKRHLYFYLASESAHEYKVKRFDRQQKFDHYFKLIEYMDQKFIEAQENNPEEFASVDAFKMFGTRVRPGFRYDGVGKDLTYEDTNEIEFNPNEED